MIARLLLLLGLVVLALAAPGGALAGSRSIAHAAENAEPCRHCAAEAHASGAASCDAAGQCAAPLLRGAEPAMAAPRCATIAFQIASAAAPRGARPDTETPPPRSA